MAAVAIHAGGSERIAPGGSLPVKGPGMLLPLSRMASRALYTWDIRSRMGQWKILVAERATDSSRPVHGGPQLVGCHKELGGPICTLKHGRIPVAHEAHLIIPLCPQ